MQGLNSLLPYNARCTSPWKKMRCSLTALQSLSTQPPWVKDCTNSPPATASVPSGKKRGANDPSCHFTGCLTNFRLALLRKSWTLTKVHPLALVSIKFLSLGSVYNHTINKEKFPDHAVQLSPLLLSQWGQKLWDHKHSSGCVMTICQAHCKQVSWDPPPCRRSSKAHPLQYRAPETEAGDGALHPVHLPQQDTAHVTDWLCGLLGRFRPLNAHTHKEKG